MPCGQVVTATTQLESWTRNNSRWKTRATKKSKPIAKLRKQKLFVCTIQVNSTSDPIQTLDSSNKVGLPIVWFIITKHSFWHFQKQILDRLIDGETKSRKRSLAKTENSTCDYTPERNKTKKMEGILPYLLIFL